MAISWGLQIKRLREERGLTQSELGRKSGLAPSHISRIEAGAYTKPENRTIIYLATGLNMTIDMLVKELRGKSPQPRQETPEDILERLRVAISFTVPIYEDFPIYAGEPVEPIGYVHIARDWARGKRLEGYMAHGKCLEPEISDGNIIIVDRDGQMDNGDIVAALVDGELYLARLRKIADELYLENNEGRIKLEESQMAAPVIEVRRRLK